MNGLSCYQHSVIGLMELIPRYVPSARCWREDDLLFSLSGRVVPQFNGVIVRDPAALTPQRLHEIESLFRSEGLAFAIEFDIPQSWPPDDLNDFLTGCGYNLTLHDPIMCCDQPLRIGRHNPDISVRRVANKSEQEAYREIMLEVFGDEMSGTTDFFDVMMGMREGYQHLAWLDGMAVGCGMLLTTNGSAAIYNVATVHESRGQGVGTAMMDSLHGTALVEGYEGTVLAVQSHAARRLYEALGYRQVGSACTYQRMQP